MRRHLVRWEQEYGERGLSLVEIEGGASEPLPIVRASVARQELRHYVLSDQGSHNHAAYGITAWPAAYLLGRDGRVVWEGNPTRVVDRPDELAELLELIESELAQEAEETAAAEESTTTPDSASVSPDSPSRD